MNLSVLLEMAADALDDRVVVGPAEGGTTARRVLESARAIGSVVASKGVDRVAYVGENDDVVPGLLFGAAVAGRPYVPISYRLPDDRLVAQLARVAPAVVVVDAAVRQRLAAHELAAGIEVVGRDELPGIEPVAGVDLVPADPEDPAVWLFTSGTTGEPKAALLRHQNLAAYVLGTVEFASAGPDEAALVSVPPYHVAGISAVLTNLYRGRRTVYLPAFDPAAWVALAQGEVVTHAMVVPTMLGRILDALEALDEGGSVSEGGGLPALRHLSYGGGRMPRPVIERALARLPHVDFVNAYGLTETSSTITVLGADDHRLAQASDDPVIAERIASVGQPVPGIELEIRGPEGGTLPTGEVGEVWVRGEQVAGEYLGRDGGLVDGWFCTRDAGRLDDEGYLYLEGRLDDVIVRGGENISPGEIEEVLTAHPSVADAAVVGVPDVEWGERVVAAVVPAAGALVDPAALQLWVRDHLRSTCTPEHLDVRADLPYNETGKLLRRVLREELAARLADPAP